VLSRTPKGRTQKGRTQKSRTPELGLRVKLVFVVLTALAVFGAAVQAGLLLPHFDATFSGVDGPATADGSVYYSTVVNTSLRPWTVVGAHLADGSDVQVLPDGSYAQLAGVYRGEQEPSSGRRVSSGLVIGTLQDLSVALVRHRVPRCREPASAPGEADAAGYAITPRQYGVGVAIEVAAPLGARTIYVTVGVSYGCGP